MSDRERALQLLQRIERESLFAAPLLQGESGVVRTIVLGVLRWRSRLDHAIESVSGRPLRKIDDLVVDILRIGAQQLLYMDITPYAAVDETVELAKRRAGRARGFVNAVLRRIAEGQAPAPDDVATRTAHPPWLIDRWSRLFGEERAERIATANQELSYPDVLVLHGEPPPDSIPSLLAPGIHKLRRSSADLDRDRFYPMDEGSGVIAAMAAAAGEEIVDLAAAPGGKSLSMLTAGRRVISNDVSFARLRPLVGKHDRIVVADGRRPPFARRHQVVLLDAPCSATGTIRKNPELKWRLQEKDLVSFTTLQRGLLSAALDLAGETVVYATCSLEPEENDSVIDAVLATRNDFRRIDAAELLQPELRQWVDSGVLRLTPESGADGFTAFVLRRTR